MSGAFRASDASDYEHEPRRSLAVWLFAHSQPKLRADLEAPMPRAMAGVGYALAAPECLVWLPALASTSDCRTAFPGCSGSPRCQPSSPRCNQVRGASDCPCPFPVGAVQTPHLVGLAVRRRNLGSSCFSPPAALIAPHCVNQQIAVPVPIWNRRQKLEAQVLIEPAGLFVVRRHKPPQHLRLQLPEWVVERHAQ